jgi:PPM family protein phosphatase
MQVESAAASDVGRVRAVNEDSYLTLPQMAVVADGMGGHACGDVASALTVATFGVLGQISPLLPETVIGGVAQANRAILEETARLPERQGMGTTVAGVALVDQGGSPHWLVFNVGDSRVYRVADGAVLQLTVDHSEVADLVAAGTITAADARTHPLRNVVTRSLGTMPAPAPDTWLLPAEPGDRFLICSDGLYAELDDRQIATVLAGAAGLAEGAQALVDAAVDAGGRDNVTVVLAAGSLRPGAAEEVAATTLPRSAHGRAT